MNQPTVRDRSTAGVEVLAAVAFDLHQHAVVAAPAAQCACEGGEQQVIGLGAVGRGCLREEGLGGAPVQADGDGLLLGRGARAFGP
ncbi:hypothetical protein, partial [Paracidovorax cattleyae]|uniref:hypothetical protein n=1 Tax=Paracidovorax cattleyae TaxID=80868 RepID=UPI003369EDBA